MARSKWLSGLVGPIAFYAVLLCSGLALAGSWAADTLSNDAATDFLDQIVPDGSVESIRRALDAALTPQSPLNDESASRALAAAEIVAAMMGSPSRHLSASCKEWAARHSRDANRGLTELAVRAVDRVGNDSETQELMQEGDGRSLQDWQASVADLKARLISR